jgi:mannose-6-phosphate isomerase class I
VTTEFFTVDELRPSAGDVLSVEAILGAAGACVAIVVLNGECELVDGRAFQPVALKRGDTALIPAAIGAATLLAAGSDLRVLAARVM